MSEHTSFLARLNIPQDLANDLASRNWARIDTGWSDATVYKLTGGNPTLYLKLEKIGPFAELQHEAPRTRWLFEQGVRCPLVLGSGAADGQNWLLMEALKGSEQKGGKPVAEHVLPLIAAALQRVHSLDVVQCPFNQRAQVRLECAEARALAGVVSAGDIEGSGRTVEQLLRCIRDLRPVEKDIVVTHGDATLDNLIVCEDEMVGFIDSGRLGIADRRQDLVLIAESIKDHFGADWVEFFFELYGAPANTERDEFYRLLDAYF